MAATRPVNQQPTIASDNNPASVPQPVSGRQWLTACAERLHQHWLLIWLYSASLLACLYHPHWGWGLVFSYWLVRLWTLGRGAQRRVVLGLCAGLSVVFLVGWGLHLWQQAQAASQIQADALMSYQFQLAPSDIRRTRTGWRAPARVHFPSGQSLPVRLQVATAIWPADQVPTGTVLTLRAQGQLIRPEPARNFGIYNTQAALADQGVDWILQVKAQPQYSVTPWALGWSQGLRQWCLAPLARWQDQGASWQSLVLKLVFNQQTPGFGDQSTSLAVLGISHFFAISGFHLVYLRRRLLAGLLRLGCSREVAAGFVGSLLLVYSWLCGWPIGSVRVLLGWGLHRVLGCTHQAERFSSLDRLSLVGLVCLLAHPTLLFQAGYLLSFGLTGLLLVCREQMGQPAINSWRHQAYCLWACLWVTWPLMMDWRYEWYPLQWLSLWLVGWLMQAWVMPLALVTGVLLWFQALDGLTAWLDQGYQAILGLLSPLMPLFHWHWITGRLGGVGLLLFLALALFWLKSGWAHPWRTGVVIVTAYGLMLGVKPLLHARGSVTILDVGQGDSLIYQAPWSAQAWLIDTGGQAPYPAQPGGPSFDLHYGDYNLIPALKAQGIGRLTGVLITHSDLDHIGSLARLAQEIPIDSLWINQATAQHPVWQEIKPYLSPQTVVHVLPAGHVSQIQPAMTAYTNHFDATTEPNDTSIATTLRLGRHQLLNLGDMSGTFEEALLARYPQIKADVLKCAHHGSRYSSSDSLLDQVRPRLAFISAGAHNTYHHPHPDTLAKLAARQIPYRVTADQGAIRFWWTDWGWEGLETALPRPARAAPSQ